MKTKTEQLLSWLLKGYEVKIGERSYCLTTENELCTKMHRFKDGDLSKAPEEAWFPAWDQSLSSFCKLAESMSEDDRFSMAAAVAIRESRPEPRRLDKPGVQHPTL